MSRILGGLGIAFMWLIIFGSIALAIVGGLLGTLKFLSWFINDASFIQALFVSVIAILFAAKVFSDVMESDK